MCTTTMSASLCSLNVRGLRERIKRRKLFLWLRKKNYDIYFLQETHSTKNDEVLWKNEWGGKAFFTYSSTNRTGCGCLIRNNANISIQNIIRDGDGRFIIMEVNIEDELFTLVNLYCPNKDEPQFFRNIFGILNNLNIDNLLLGGDINFVQDIDFDKIGRNLVSFRQSREVLNKFLNEENLIDIWRIRHPTEKKFTWQRRNPEVFCRLDYFFIPLNKSADVKSAEIYPAILTDHSLISVTFIFHSEKRGPGFWKLNCSLLNDVEFIRTIKTVILTTIEESKTEKYTHSFTWELIKFNVKNEASKYASEAKKADSFWIQFF